MQREHHLPDGFPDGCSAHALAFEPSFAFDTDRWNAREVEGTLYVSIESVTVDEDGTVWFGVAEPPTQPREN